MGFWTEEKIVQLADLYKEGESFRDISKTLGCSRNGVAGKIIRLREKGDTRFNKIGTTKKPYVLKSNIPVKKPRLKQEVGRAKRVRKPRPVMVGTEPESKKLTMSELKNNQCRWPTGELKTGITFCGADVEDHMSYCEYHTEKSIRRKVCQE